MGWTLRGVTPRIVVACALFVGAACSTSSSGDSQGGITGSASTTAADITAIADPSSAPRYESAANIGELIEAAGISCSEPTKLGTKGEDNLECQLKMTGGKGDYYRSISWERYEYDLPAGYNAPAQDEIKLDNPYGYVVGANWLLTCGNASTCEPFVAATKGLLLAGGGQISDNFAGPAPEIISSAKDIAETLLAKGFPCQNFRVGDPENGSKLVSGFCELPYSTNGVTVKALPFAFGDTLAIWWSGFDIDTYKDTRATSQQWGTLDSGTWWIACESKAQCVEVANVLNMPQSAVSGSLTS